MVIHEGHKLGPLLFHADAFLFIYSHLSPLPLSLSLSRLWSSWIPNFSRCLTWSRLTGATGRNWIRRDNVARVFLRQRAPAVATSQKQVAALWPKRAAHPAAATMLMAHPLNLLVSFRCHLWAALLGFFFLLNAACDWGSAVHAEVLGLCSSLLLLLEMSFRKCVRRYHRSFFLLPSVFLCWRLTDLC